MMIIVIHLKQLHWSECTLFVDFTHGEATTRSSSSFLKIVTIHPHELCQWHRATSRCLTLFNVSWHWCLWRHSSRGLQISGSAFMIVRFQCSCMIIAWHMNTWCWRWHIWWWQRTWYWYWWCWWIGLCHCIHQRNCNALWVHSIACLSNCSSTSSISDWRCTWCKSSHLLAKR